MEKEKERITDPKKPIKMSPAPGLADALVR